MDHPKKPSIRSKKQIITVFLRVIRQSGGPLTLKQTACVRTPVIFFSRTKEFFLFKWAPVLRWFRFAPCLYNWLSVWTPPSSALTTHDWGLRHQWRGSDAVPMSESPMRLSVYWFFLNTVRCCAHNGTLWLLHWPAKTSHRTRSHHPDKAIEETLHTVMRSFSDLCPAVCDLLFLCCITPAWPLCTEDDSRAILPPRLDGLVSCRWISHVSLKFRM